MFAKKNLFWFFFSADFLKDHFGTLLEKKIYFSFFSFFFLGWTFPIDEMTLKKSLQRKMAAVWDAMTKNCEKTPQKR